MPLCFRFVQRIGDNRLEKYPGNQTLVAKIEIGHARFLKIIQRFISIFWDGNRPVEKNKSILR